MERIGVTAARGKLYKLVENTALTNQPVTILGKSGNAVLISEEDWKAIQATLYLGNMPGMTESILEASMEAREQPETLTPLDEVDW